MHLVQAAPRSLLPLRALDPQLFVARLTSIGIAIALNGLMMKHIEPGIGAGFSVLSLMDLDSSEAPAI